jgi:hypothetical protein
MGFQTNSLKWENPQPVHRYKLEDIRGFWLIHLEAALNSPSNELTISEALPKSALPSAENRHDSKIQLPLI